MMNEKFLDKSLDNQLFHQRFALTMNTHDTMTVTGGSSHVSRHTTPNGNSGSRSGSASHNKKSNKSLGEKQLDDILTNSAAKKVILDLILNISSSYPNAKAWINKVSCDGMVTIQVDNLSYEQAKSIGLNPRIGMNIRTASYTSHGVFFNIPSGKRITVFKNSEKHSPSHDIINRSRLGTLASLIKGVIPKNYLIRDGYIGSMAPAYTWMSHGHGERSFTPNGKKFVADKELTDVYKKSITERNKECDNLKNTVKFTADFYQDVFAKFGKKASLQAKELANLAHGHTIRNIDDALRSFDKYKNTLYLKYNAYDINAIANALSAIDKQKLSSSLAKFSKAFSVTSSIIDFYDLGATIRESLKTKNWRPTFIKIESMLIGKLAVSAVALLFSIIFSTNMGIIGFGLLIAMMGALINDDFIEKMNFKIGI